MYQQKGDQYYLREEVVARKKSVLSMVWKSLDRDQELETWQLE